MPVLQNVFQTVPAMQAVTQPSLKETLSKAVIDDLCRVDSCSALPSGAVTPVTTDMTKSLSRAQSDLNLLQMEQILVRSGACTPVCGASMSGMHTPIATGTMTPLGNFGGPLGPLGMPNHSNAVQNLCNNLTVTVEVIDEEDGLEEPVDCTGTVTASSGTGNQSPLTGFGGLGGLGAIPEQPMMETVAPLVQPQQPLCPDNLTQQLNNMLNGNGAGPAMNNATNMANTGVATPMANNSGMCTPGLLPTNPMTAAASGTQTPNHVLALLGLTPENIEMTAAPIQQVQQPVQPVVQQQPVQQQPLLSAMGGMSGYQTPMLNNMGMNNNLAGLQSGAMTPCLAGQIVSLQKQLDTLFQQVNAASVTNTPPRVCQDQTQSISVPQSGYQSAGHSGTTLSSCSTAANTGANTAANSAPTSGLEKQSSAKTEEKKPKKKVDFSLFSVAPEGMKQPVPFDMFDKPRLDIPSCYLRDPCMCKKSGILKRNKRSKLPVLSIQDMYAKQFGSPNVNYVKGAKKVSPAGSARVSAVA